MSLTGQLLEKCASFEWRGPYHSLVQVEGDFSKVLKSKSDWSAVVGDKPLIDKRNGNMADLFPKNRDILSRVIGGLQADAKPKKSFGPGMG